MVSVCTVPARGGRSCEHFGGYKTINRIPLPLLSFCVETMNLILSVHENCLYRILPIKGTCPNKRTGPIFHC